MRWEKPIDFNTASVRNSLLNKKGIVLIAAIMLVVFASIIILSATIFIIQRLSEVEARRIQTVSMDLAHAGVQQALYFFRFHDIAANGYFTFGQTNIDASNSFVLGGTAADLLMVNTATAAFSANGKDLENLTIQNATNSQTITIDRMIVSWNNAQQLQRIRINNNDLWSGNLNSPADANITDFTLNTTPTIYPIIRIRFGGSMVGTTISVQFVMTGGSTKNVTVYPASNNYNFIVNSTGKTTGSNIYRTLRSEYNANTGRIVSYNETNTQVVP